MSPDHPLRYLIQLSKKNILLLIILGVLGIIGIFMIRYATPYGLGMVNDSVGYVAGARNIIAGNGYSRTTGNGLAVQITNYPPFFSIIIASINFFGLEAIRASRLLVLLCFGLNIVLIGILSKKITGSDIWAIIGAVIILISEPFLRIHTFALTEPLYIALVLLTILSFSEYIEHESSIWLALAGVISSLAYITRYVGIVLYGVIITSLVIKYFVRKNIQWKRFGLSILVYLVSSLPVALAWNIRNMLVTGNPANRQLVYHPIPYHKYIEGITNFWQWLMPDSVVEVISIHSIWGYAFIAVFAFLSVYICRFVILKVAKNMTRRLNWEIFLLSLHGITYLILLILTLSFLDLSPIFEDRILSPYYISVILSSIGLLASIKTGARFSKFILPSFFIGVFLLLSAPDSIRALSILHQDGQGYISYRWRVSPTIETIPTIPDDVVIFSNKPNAVYLLSGRPSYALLSPQNPATGQVREGYDGDLSRIRSRVEDGEAVLVIFGYQDYKNNSENQNTHWILSLSEGVPIFADFWDGTILGYLP